MLQVLNSSKMDFATAFAVLLYLNVYYFGFFACFEFALLVFKVAFRTM